VRDEWLGAALLVGVAVATLVLTLANAGSSGTISGPGRGWLTLASAPTPREAGQG